MKIYLNGNEYHLRAGTGVTRVPLVEFQRNIRLIGQQRRDDRSNISSWAIDDWSAGLGIERMNINISRHTKSLWDVENCDTRHPSFICLSPAFNTCTVNPSRGDLDFLLPYKDKMYMVTTGTSRAFEFVPPNTLGSDTKLGGGNAETDVLCGIKAFSSRIGLTHRFGGGSFFKFQTSIAGQPQGSLNLTHSGGVGSHRSVFAALGLTLNLACYDSDSVVFYSANQILGSINQMGVAPANVPGSYPSPLVTDGLNMFAQLTDGVYDVDLSSSIAIDTSRALEKNGAMVMFRNELYFKNRKSLMHYDGSVPTSIGYDLNDGLPSDKDGEITAMVSTWKNIFAAVKGATYSHILSYDGDAWQYYARVPTAGIWIRDMVLSNSPDAIDRLWCVFGNHPYPGYYLNPMVNPLQAATYSFVGTGHFTPPIFDGGMSEERGAFYGLFVSADGMDGSNSIVPYYGINGDSPVTTLGVVATSGLRLDYGSDLGVECYRIQNKYMLTGANSGTTPIFREGVNQYLKLPRDRESFEFTVDLVKSSEPNTRPLEAVLGSLNYERGSRTLMPFWYGRVATKNVKVLAAPSFEEITEEDIFEGERSGFQRIKVAEIL